MNLIPSIKQFSRWSKPSQYTALAFLLGIISFPFVPYSTYLAVISPSLDDIRKAFQTVVDPLVYDKAPPTMRELHLNIRNHAAALRPDRNVNDLSEEDLAAGFKSYIEPYRDNLSLYYRAEAALRSLQGGNVEKYQISLDRGLELSPGDMPLLYDKARSHVFALQYDEARAILEEIQARILAGESSKHPSLFSVQLALANFGYIGQRYLEILDTYELAVSQWENQEGDVPFDIMIVEPLTNVVGHRLFRSRGKLGELALRYRLSNIYMRLGEHEKARDQLEHVLAVRKKIGENIGFFEESDLRLALALASAMTGNIERANELANTVIGSEPQYISGFSQPSDYYLQAIFVKGLAYVMEGRFVKAKVYLERYLSKADKDNFSNWEAIPIASAYLANLYMAEDAPEQAMNLFTKLNEDFTISNFAPSIRLELATADAFLQYYLENPEGFRAALQKAYAARRELPPTNFIMDANLYWLESLMLESEGRISEASALEDRVLGLLAAQTSFQASILRDNISRARDQRHVVNQTE